MRLQNIIDEIFEETTNEDLRNWIVLSEYQQAG